jgi:hypothetical protein
MNRIKTLTIDIINDKAIKLIQDMELMKLINIRKENTQQKESVDWASIYKGTMNKQPLDELDIQLNDLQYSWE